jgi:acetyl esterase/lipase
MLLFGGGGFNPNRRDLDQPLSRVAEDVNRKLSSVRSLGMEFSELANYFARRGMVILRVEYRKRKTDGVLPDKAVEDARSAIRWVRSHAAAMGIDADRIVVCGGSSGGHLAASLAALDDFDAPDDDASISVAPNVMILHYPLLDFLKGGTRKQTFLSALDGDCELGFRLSPARHWRATMPPTLVFIGTRDPMYETVRDFVARWKAAGQDIDLFIGEGGHGFSLKSPWLEKAAQRMDDFLQKVGYLSAEPKVKLPSRQTGRSQ